MHASFPPFTRPSPAAPEHPYAFAYRVTANVVAKEAERGRRANELAHPSASTARAEPTAAISDTESKLRTAVHYLYHANLLLQEIIQRGLTSEAEGITTVYDSGPRELSADFTRDRDATGA